MRVYHLMQTTDEHDKTPTITMTLAEMEASTKFSFVFFPRAFFIHEIFCCCCTAVTSSVWYVYKYVNHICELVNV